MNIQALYSILISFFGLYGIEPYDHESIVYIIWIAILGLEFPVAKGYIIRPQDQHTSQSGEHGFSDLHVFQYRNTASNADKFLIIQCKRAVTESREAVWKEAVNQLRWYLDTTHGRRPPAARTPVYGIAAVGK